MDAPPGITSACAEQTSYEPHTCMKHGDHLRVCGADFSQTATDGLQQGSPPRVRSRRQQPPRRHGRPGITSACAEQTMARLTNAENRGDHLRVCGADKTDDYPSQLDLGSPPRVRSRRTPLGRHPGRTGITSACAEQTRMRCAKPQARWDHLRVCGADSESMWQRPYKRGSPPRVRSRRNCRG